jgi:hypothetical protein
MPAPAAAPEATPLMDPSARRLGTNGAPATRPVPDRGLSIFDEPAPTPAAPSAPKIRRNSDFVA